MQQSLKKSVTWAIEVSNTISSSLSTTSSLENHLLLKETHCVVQSKTHNRKNVLLV